MRIVAADTSPIRYLLVIGKIEILPALFGTVIIPTVVRDELCHPRAPEAVRTWMQPHRCGWNRVSRPPFRRPRWKILMRAKEQPWCSQRPLAPN